MLLYYTKSWSINTGIKMLYRYHLRQCCGAGLTLTGSGSGSGDRLRLPAPAPGKKFATQIERKKFSFEK